jgi:hypothetical protein
LYKKFLDHWDQSLDTSIKTMKSVSFHPRTCIIKICFSDFIIKLYIPWHLVFGQLFTRIAKIVYNDIVMNQHFLTPIFWVVELQWIKLKSCLIGIFSYNGLLVLTLKFKVLVVVQVVNWFKHCHKDLGHGLWSQLSTNGKSFQISCQDT